ncbi:MAG: 50S ribosomal protein L30 [Thiotrichales bacterium 32-46-8]|jgi:large subunit ribosomal protein L30|nr:50S ribosomal protein L30 [Gammaproteobacteria bacterium]OYX06301.1 MAG: 50S ribosomal protein L30 [Thiotrichales bacterium 32-46-8]OYY24214.1 MAG: 50S ribosomal protein L30 [Thiotrichales bacterium 35-46-9]OYZ07613.1 MAG: 50S ribosomal protein L30 [Thiotrichales bacterium 16-46-22]OYZ42739.1 MAG: 50S ribosomal protein L30 [Thiotrichales bacterium 24-47-4]OZA20363.1 MAG: 50S ribosomal protein L30 [Thiotrichales bacterium 17-46-47]OZA73289.1 MAG: 50S ribosomal protein L30 [Thiotrichales bac
MSQVKVTLVKSPIGRKPNHIGCVKGLGLRKVNHSRVLKDSPEVRGMIRTISYLVKVEEVA